MAQGEPPNVLHVRLSDLPLALLPRHIFVGTPCNEFVPTPWVNPYAHLPTPGTKFREYAWARSDRSFWVSNLAGCTLVCTCALGSECHTFEILRLFRHCMPTPFVNKNKLEVPKHGCTHAFGQKEVSPTCDEAFVSECWLDITRSIREAKCKVLWEIMAGSATISRIFESAGWSIGPPVDVDIEPWMNLLSPAAITSAMSVIHEGRISLL